MTSPASQSLASAIKPFVDGGTLAGAVMAVADRDATLALEAVGWADIEAAKPMRPDTLFWIASSTKPMTATVFMMLVEEGAIGLDEPVSKYLPAFGDLPVAVSPEGAARRSSVRPMRVRHLLSHTSGLPFSSPEEAGSRDALSPAEAGAAYARLSLLADPGEAYNYSNVGINLAAHLLEVVSGENYEAFISRRLLCPLGMNDTVFHPSGERLARLAKTYHAAAGGGALVEGWSDHLRYPLDDLSRGVMAGGGLFSTAADVMRFARMFLRGGELDGRRYLTEETVRLMTSDQTGPVKANYGLGWGVREDGFGHGGALRNDMTIDIKNGFARLFLVQQLGDWPEGVIGGQVVPAFARAAEKLMGVEGTVTPDGAGVGAANAGTGTR